MAQLLPRPIGASGKISCVWTLYEFGQLLVREGLGDPRLTDLSKTPSSSVISKGRMAPPVMVTMSDFAKMETNRHAATSERDRDVQRVSSLRPL